VIDHRLRESLHTVPRHTVDKVKSRAEENVVILQGQEGIYRSIGGRCRGQMTRQRNHPNSNVRSALRNQLAKVVKSPPMTIFARWAEPLSRTPRR